MNFRNTPVLPVLGPLVVASAVLAGVVSPTGSDIGYGANGPALAGSAGVLVPLGARALLAPCKGPDGNTTSADDRVLLMTGIGDVPVITSLSTPNLPSNSSRLTRLGATSAIFACAGSTHGNWGTSGDGVHFLSRLGSENLSVKLTLGFLGEDAASTPQRLTAQSAVVVGRGPDGNANTADDQVFVLGALGFGNAVIPATVPFLAAGARSQPVVLSPKSFLIASDGPDGAGGTDDDVVYFIRLYNSNVDRVDLPTPRLGGSGDGPSRPVRLSATRALVSSEGPDGNLGTGDDVLYLLDGLEYIDATPTVTAVPVGSLFDGDAGRPTRLAEDRAVVGSPGIDLVEGTADDRVVVLWGLGDFNSTIGVTVGYLDPSPASRPVALDSTTCALVSFGADAGAGTADDEVVVLSQVGSTNAVAHVPVGGVAGGAAGRIEPLSATSLLVMTGGTVTPGTGAGGDSAVVLLTNLPGAPAIQNIPTGGNTSDPAELGYSPVDLGHGRAAHQVPGGDGTLGTGADDAVRVLAGLPESRSLAVTKLTLGFSLTLPEKGETFSVKALLATADDAAFGDTDLTVSVGNFSETIPASSLRLAKGKWTYRQVPGGPGTVSTLTYDPAKGKLAIKGKGIDSRVETTDPAYVPVAVERGDDLIGDSVAGTAYSKGIKFKAPRR